MTDKIQLSEIPEFDVAEYLTTEEDVAAYLTVVLEDNDPALLVSALEDIARARGMTFIVTQSGLSREPLRRASQPAVAPRFDTVNKVCAALGLKLVAVSLHAA